MTISTNDTAVSDDAITTTAGLGGAVADAFTWLRILMMPLIAFLIWKGWQPVAAGGINLVLTLAASFLFIVAALTDVIDDYFGGNSRSLHRRFGFMDDIADTVLVVGTLLMLWYVTNRAGYSSWTFTLPVVILVLREIIVGLFKGFELARFGWPDSRLANAKAGFSMLAVCLLLASPWLQNWIDKMRAGDDIAAVFANPSPWVWVAGTVSLWIAAIISILTAMRIFKTKFAASNDV